MTTSICTPAIFITANIQKNANRGRVNCCTMERRFIEHGDEVAAELSCFIQSSPLIYEVYLISQDNWSSNRHEQRNHGQ